MEMTAQHSQIRFGTASVWNDPANACQYYSPPNSTFFSRNRFDAFICPSDVRKSLNYFNGLTLGTMNLDTSNPPYPLHNYVGCGGNGWLPMQCTYDNGWIPLVYEGWDIWNGYGGPNPYHGALFKIGSGTRQWQITMGEIFDGTSNTLAISEVIQANQDAANTGSWSLENDGRGFIMMSSLCLFSAYDTPNAGVDNLQDLCVTLANPDMPCIYNGGFLYNTISARSRHSGGVNAGLCDGSIRFVANTINLALWRNAASTQSGQSSGL